MLWLHNGGWGVETTVGCTAAVALQRYGNICVEHHHHISSVSGDKTKHVLYVENLVLRAPDGILFFLFVGFIEIWQLN